MEIKAKKALGQNFLVDKSVVEDLIATAEIGPDDLVIEVGAGTGVVTKELAKRAKRVIAVEFDRDLIPILEKELEGFENVEIINQDILELPITNYQLPNFRIIGSIPYQITSPLIHKLLIEEPRPTLIVFLVQLEVAEKICARPPKATYLSNFIEAFGEAKIIRKISPSAFEPPPKVDSAILKINLNQPPGLGSESKAERFSNFLHRGFKNPRKMLNKAFPKEVLEKSGIGAARRPQTLSLREWLTLYKEFRNP